MLKKLVFFDKKFEISQSYLRLFLSIFIVAVLSKGAVIFRGSAVDDYSFISGISSGSLNLCISQGRYINAAILWIMDTLGVNVIDMYFSLGIVTLLLYSAFVASILRFVGIDKSPAASLAGGIIIAHPYLTEILTFRIALPTFSVALIFSIITFEILAKTPVTWKAKVWALLATLAMLFTYQVFINYFAIAIIFAFICGQIFYTKNSQLMTSNIYQERAITLTIISVIATIIFLIITRLAKAMGLANMTGRSHFVTVEEIPLRIEQISSTLSKIYWFDEPVFSGWLKMLVTLMLITSVMIIFWHLFTKRHEGGSFKRMVFVVCALLLLIPMSLGLIIAFKDWWPVPRVVAHVAISIGLIFLLADLCIQNSGCRFLKLSIFVVRLVILIGFVFLSNQILADQQRINQWDKMMANRIVSRLEAQPNFSSVKFVHISGGSWLLYPALLRTGQGDMNVSALAVNYAKAALLSEVSGYDFKWATGDKVATGENYCANKQPWPHLESVTIDNGLAIICLKKQP